MKFIIGIDIGTSATKGVAIDDSGATLEEAQKSYSPIIPEPGYHELDPDTVLHAVIDVLIDMIKKTSRLPGLAGVSFSCAMHSLIAVDKEGRPLMNAITWADNRSKNQAAALKHTPIGDSIYENSGTPVHSMSPLCKITWIRETEPDVFANTYKFIGIKEYLWNYFFGEYLVDYSLASATGLFDIRKLVWLDDALKYAGISTDHLSVPVSPTHMNRQLPNARRAELGLSDDLSFIIGGSDGCLANLGCNAVGDGDAALTIGTSGALRMTSAMPKHDSKQRIFNYILTDKLFVSGGAINNGGVVLQWFVQHFMQISPGESKNYAQYIEQAGTVAPGSEGLVFLPYLLGERAPIWDSDAKGVFFGVGMQHTQIHFLRSVLEGISFSLFQVGVSLEETIGPIQNIYASGGFIQSPLWLQMIADIFNRKVFVTGESDASAVGAALLGFVACGRFGDIEDTRSLVKPVRIFEPDRVRHEAYRKNFLIFVSLYDRLKDEFKSL